MQCRKRQTFFESALATITTAPPLTAVLVGIKHSNQCQQQRTNVVSGNESEHEHLEIRMQTADRRYIW
jgi:hypothetical protein